MTRRRSWALRAVALRIALRGLVLWLAGVAAVQGQDYLPAPELVLEAIGQQAEVLAADERVAAAQAQARALAVGSYELEASLVPQRRRTDHEGEFDEFEVQLGRQFRLPGKAPLDRRIGAHTRAIAGFERDEAVRQAAQRLLDLWMQWLRAAALDEEARDQERLLQAEHAALSRQVELGDAARLDLDLLTAELAQARAIAVRSAAALALARRALSSDFPQIPLPVRAPPLPEPAPLAGDPQAWSERVVRGSAELKARQEEAARQEAAAARARADQIPDPSIGIRLLDERNGEERSMGLVFSMPLGGRHRRAVAAAERSAALALQRDADAVERNVVREAHALVALAGDALAQWRAQQAARAAMSAAADRVHRAWELGEAGLADRLLAERRARETAYEELSARVDAHEAQLRVRIESRDLWRLPTQDAAR